MIASRKTGQRKKYNRNLRILRIYNKEVNKYIKNIEGDKFL